MIDKKKILIEVSNRHVHLSRKHIDKLFGKNYKLTKKRDLSQPGQFAAEEIISLINNNKIIDNVRILGPKRNKTQIEILKSDADYLGLNACLRHSGELENTCGIILKGLEGEIKLDNGVIIAKKHLHISDKDAKELGLKDKDIIKIKVNDKILKDILVRAGDSHKLALHIDKEEGDLLGIDRIGYGEIID